MKTFITLSLLLAAAGAQACPCGCVRTPADSALDRLGAGQSLAVELRHDVITQEERSDGATPHIGADHRITTLGIDTRLGGILWSLALPRVEREMRITSTGATQTINGLGDVSLTARVPFQGAEILAGIKLPTGDSDTALLVPRRYLQLGTGSTDLILGVRWEGEVGDKLARGFVQLAGQAAVDADEHFRPGETLGLSAGLSRELGAGFSVVLQAAAVRQFRDHNTMVSVDPTYGEDKESETHSIFVTPGLVWQSGSGTRAYVLLTESVDERNYAEQGGRTVNPIHATRVVTVGLSHAF
jgi:hypothetical protein